MVKFNLFIAFLFANFIAQAQVPRKAIVEHFSNTNCSVCGSRNPGFYTNLAGQATVLHLAIHPSSPYSDCKLSLENSTANDDRTKYYGIYGSTPRLVISGNVIIASTSYADPAIFAPYLAKTTPASIRIEQKKYGADSIQSTIIVKTEAAHSLPALSLFVALAEDTVFYTGRNGETKHYDVFRKSLSSTVGISLTLPPVMGDSIVFTYSSPINPVWNSSRIYTLAVLQETSSKNLIQAESVSPNLGKGTTRISESFKLIKANIYPNPSSNILNIELMDQITSIVSIVDVNGKLYKKIEVFSGRGTIDMSNLINGIYFVRIQNQNGQFDGEFLKQ